MDDKKRVNIKFQYYQLCIFDGDQYTEDLFDLIGWLGKIADMSLEETVHEVDGIEGRMEKALPVMDNKFYALNFMRLDVISNTYILRKDEEARHVDLDENEYIGRNTVVLYDPNHSILMIQCNRGSYGAFSLQNYINSFNESDNLCYFRPIVDNLDIDDLKRYPAAKLDVRFANTRKFTPHSRFFERVINSCAEIECYAAHLEFSLGYVRAAELERDTVYEVACDLTKPENREAVSSARIKLNSDQKSGVIDLFNNVAVDNIAFTIPPRKELDFNTMYNAMLKQYYEKGSRNRLYHILEKE